MSAPLAGLKILDFSSLLPGPFATMMLADLGAEVIRIEAPKRPEITKLMPPIDENGISSTHALLNRSKRSLGLNLKSEAAIKIVKALISDGFNIIVEQSRPGVMTRLGVGYETLKEDFPDLIYCSLTGYGQTGPYKDRAGHDLNYLALSGMLGHYGRQDSKVPAPLPVQVADIGAGSMHLVIALLSAVIRRGTTGEGAAVDISMHDGALAWNSLAIAETVVSAESPVAEKGILTGGSFYDLYETADGRQLSVGSLEPKFWSGFCQAIGREDLIDIGQDFSYENQQGFKEDLRAILKSKTLAEWENVFSDIDVCVEAVLSSKEALEHPHTIARNMMVEVPVLDQLGELGGSSQLQVASPIKLSGHTPSYKFAGTKLGAHSTEILKSIGYSQEEIKKLKSEEIVA